MADHPLIQLQDVAKSLGAQRVLDGVNLSLHRGEITAIIGKSGSGKSVLLKHIIGLIEPDGGEILFDGKPRSAMNASERSAAKRKFSYVFQDTALFDFLNVFENIALPLTERRVMPKSDVAERVRAKLSQLDLHDVETKYPSQLSGGMKKRVALARALITEPEIVLFDEPTTGLDPIRKNAVHSMILDYQRRFGFTGVVVSHEIPDIFFIAQRVAMIDEGRILIEGTPEEVQSSSSREVRNFIEGLETPHDDLTGIDSAAIGQTRLLQEMSRLQRFSIPFSVVLLVVESVDGVDRIAGHMAGQALFRAFAGHVIQNTYITDTCFRQAINKIMVVLPDTAETQARDFCRKLARTLNSHIKRSAGEALKGFGFTVSAGVAQASIDSSLQELISEAEQSKTVFYKSREAS
ncbi:MAG: ATP-binding cassette domain-containing protein [Desulfobacterales bacterium]